MAIIQYYARNLNKNTNPIQIIFKKSADFEIPFGYKFADICVVGGGSSGITNMINLAKNETPKANGEDAISYPTGKYLNLQSIGGAGGFVRNFYKQKIDNLSKIHVEIGDGGVCGKDEIPCLSINMGNKEPYQKIVGKGKDTFIKDLLTNNIIYIAYGGGGFADVQFLRTKMDGQCSYGIELIPNWFYDLRDGSVAEMFFNTYIDSQQPARIDRGNGQGIAMSLGGGNLGGNAVYRTLTKYYGSSKGPYRADQIGHNGGTKGVLIKVPNDILRESFPSYSSNYSWNTKKGWITYNRVAESEIYKYPFSMKYTMGPNELYNFGPTRVFQDGEWLAGGGGGTNIGTNCSEYKMEFAPITPDYSTYRQSGRFGGQDGGGLCASVGCKFVPKGNKNTPAQFLIDSKTIVAATDGAPNMGGGGGSGISIPISVEYSSNKLDNICPPGKGGSGVCYMRLYPNDITEGVVFNNNNTIIIE